MASLAGQAQPLTMVSRLVNGVVGGLAGGLLFGILMQAIGMIPMVAMLVGSKSVVVGWVVHLAISSFIGASFAVLFGGWATQIVPAALFGLGYGVVWWDDPRVDKTRIRSRANPAAVGGPGVAAYCLPQRLDYLERRGSPPWAPGQREEIADVEQNAGTGDIWCMAEVDIFADMSTEEMETLAEEGPGTGLPDLRGWPGSHHCAAHARHDLRGDAAARPADARQFRRGHRRGCGVRDEPGRRAALPSFRCADRSTNL